MRKGVLGFVFSSGAVMCHCFAGSMRCFPMSCPVACSGGTEATGVHSFQVVPMTFQMNITAREMAVPVLSLRNISGDPAWPLSAHGGPPPARLGIATLRCLPPPARRERRLGCCLATMPTGLAPPLAVS